MFRILEARFLAPEVKYFRISAPWIARKHRDGQFVILRSTAEGERIPLTIADSDLERGWIALVVQGVGKTTKLLNTFEAGGRIVDLAGPLGNPMEIRKFGTVVAMYRSKGRGSLRRTVVIGYVGSIGIATLSDSIIPYLGEWMLDLPSRGLHLGFIERWWLVNPLAVPWPDHRANDRSHPLRKRLRRAAGKRPLGVPSRYRSARPVSCNRSWSC